MYANTSVLKLSRVFQVCYLQVKQKIGRIVVEDANVFYTFTWKCTIT